MNRARHIAFALNLALLVSPITKADEALEHARQVLNRAILFDGHNDLPNAIHKFKDAPDDIVAYDLRVRAPGKGQTDIPRLREGRLGAQFWSVYIPPEAGQGFARMQLEQIDLARRSRPVASARCSASKAATRSRIRSGRYAPTTSSACAT